MTKVNKRKKSCYLSYGVNLFDFFIVPTIGFHADDGFGTYLTIEWLKWYVGVKWYKKWGE